MLQRWSSLQASGPKRPRSERPWLNQRPVQKLPGGTMKAFFHSIRVFTGILAIALGLLPGLATAAEHSSPLQLGNTITIIASTVPANGDVNPYGVAVVAHSSGLLVQGNILVSNFNSSANLQGTGTTIVQIAPNGTASLFAQINANSLPG